MSGNVGDYLAGLSLRLDEVERVQRVGCMLDILNIVNSYGSPEDALELFNIFESIVNDESKYDIDDLRKVANDLQLQLSPKMSETTKKMLNILLDRVANRK
jgi:hypothetical protein